MPPLLLQRCWQLRDGAVPVAVWIWLVLSPMLVVHMNECRLRSLPVQTVALYLDSPTSPLSWTLAQCGAAVVFDPHGVISQRSLGKDGVLRDGALQAKARRPAWEIWQNLRLWFAYVQHLEIGACSHNAHLGRSRALVRDLNRVLEGLYDKVQEGARQWTAVAPVCTAVR